MRCSSPVTLPGISLEIATLIGYIRASSFGRIIEPYRLALSWAHVRISPNIDEPGEGPRSARAPRSSASHSDSNTGSSQ
jgi:hypothetical protein